LKKILFMFATLTVLVLAACSGGNESTSKEETNVIKNQNDNTVITKSEEPKEEEVEQEQTQANDNQLESVVNYFESNGYSIGEKSVKAFEMVKATEGFGIEVNGANVEFYSYDPNSEALKEIQSSGKYNMDGFEIEAVANGNIVMMGHQFHPEKDKIIETFNSYQ